MVNSYECLFEEFQYNFATEERGWKDHLTFSGTSCPQIILPPAPTFLLIVSGPEGKILIDSDIAAFWYFKLVVLVIVIWSSESKVVRISSVRIWSFDGFIRRR